MAGENRLLVIGIDEYSDTRYKRIHNAKRDVDRFTKVLQDRYGFTLAQPPILDEDATRENITDALTNLEATGFKDDNLVIYFAGHGEQHPISHIGYWVPIDGVNKSSNFIFNSTIIDIIKGIPAKHILLISDSCFAGTFLTQTRSSGRILTDEELEQLDSRWILVSGGEETVSDGIPGKGSPFGMSICEFLESNKKSAVPAGELFDYVIRRTESRIDGSQIPAAAPIKCDANQGGQMIFRLSQPPEVVNVEATQIPKINFPLPETPSLEYYIPRTVTYYEYQKSEIAFFFEPERGKSYLKDLIKTQKRIVLLGSAGSGKSVELQQLVRLLQDFDDFFVPIYKRFNTYTEEDIEKYLPDLWDEINPETTIIFLDGLDEIQPRFFNTAVRKIMSFSQKNPSLSIIISCRTNFYELPDPNFSGTLEGFNVYMLNDISLSEIKVYATNHFRIDGDEFVREVYEALLADLVQKPYFLNILIRYFIKNGNFLVKRSDIMEEAIANLYNSNRENHKTSDTLLDKYQVFLLLEKIAFIMEVLGKNFITDEELHKLFPATSDFNNCKTLPAFKRNADRNQWMFEHNNIQEYIASKVLSKESFEKLIQIISIPSPTSTRIKPTWVNTLSFLVSISDDEKNQELFDWIIANDLEVIIKFEPDRIIKERRIEIFKQIFDSYSNKEVWISSNKFSNKDLAAFGQFNEVLDFLLLKINTADTLQIEKFNAIHILRDFDLTHFGNRVEEIKTSLFHVLDLSELPPLDIYSVLGTLARLRITDKETVSRIISKYSKRKNQYIRAGLYKLLHNSKFADEFIDVFIDGIDLNKIEEAIDDRESVNLMDESFHLKIGLDRVHEPVAVKKLISKFSDPENEGYFYSGDYKEIITSLIHKAVSISKEDSDMFDIMVKFFLSSVNHYNRKTSELILPFFEMTGTKWDVFINTWKNEHIKGYVRGEIFNLLFDDQILIQFIEELKNESLSKDDLIQLHDLIITQKSNQPSKDLLLDIVEAEALAFPGLEFKRPEIKNWNEINKINTQLSFDLLFDQQILIGEIERIFIKFEKEELTRDDLFYMRSSGNKEMEDSFISSAIDLLRDLTYGGVKISFNTVKNWIQGDIRFTHYQIEKIYTYLHGSYSNFIEVTDEQIEFIRKWCTDIGDDMRILWFFIQHFKIQLQEHKIFSLISNYYDFNTQANLEDPGTIDLIEPFISKEKIRDEISTNLKEGLDNDLAWVSNASYAIRQNYKDTFDYIVKHLETTNHDEYKFNDVLTLWFKKSNNAERLCQFIENSVSSILKWKAISLLANSKKDKSFLVKYLHRIIDESTDKLEDRFLAATYLMQLNDIAGLEFTGNYILQNPDPKFDFNFHLRNLSNVNQPEAIPLLMKLLFVSKGKEFTEDRFNNLELKILDSIHNIGIQSNEAFGLIKSALILFIETNKYKLDNLNFLYITIDRIEDQLNMRKAQNYSLDEAIREFNNLNTH